MIDDRIPILLDRIATHDLKLANLFQFQPGGFASGPWLWQANLTDGIKVWEFGRGPTASAALEAAIAAVAKPPVASRRPPAPRPPASPQPQPGHTYVIIDEDEMMV